MKMLRTILSCLFAVVVVVAFAADSEDGDLASPLWDLSNLELVTKKPHKMQDTTLELCRAPTELPLNLHEGFRQAAYCNVYVTEAAKDAMFSGQGTYPVGSLVVKSKLRSPSAKEIELFTVMRKLEEGYDPKHGDWEYSVVDGRSMRVLARGRIDSCIDCHDQYRETDFVTRAYLPDNATESEE